MEVVQREVLKMINTARANRGKHNYVWSADLNATAQDRSTTLRNRNPGLGWSYPAGGTHWRYSQSE